MLTVDHVNKTYVGHQALTDVSLEVPQGSVYGLLGPNGAGKTTLIRILNHITIPDSGIVTFDGHKLSGQDMASIGYLPEERGLYKKMRVGEQAVFFGRLKGLTQRQATDAAKYWFQRLGMTGWWNKKVAELSKGMAQKVQFVITVLHRPKLLIFDEPFSGFDPVNASALKEEILHVRDTTGATIIFSTHDMGSVEQLCDHITLINNSRNVLSGKVSDIRAHYGADRYQLIFQPLNDDTARQTLEDALRPIAQSLQVDAVAGNARLVLRQPDMVRQMIQAVNEAVELRSFQPYRPSINDIFIEVVTGKASTLQS